MTYVELPCHRLAPGKPVPFNVWNGRGNLLTRKSDRVLSAQQHGTLAAQKACVGETRFKAWQRSYERMFHKRFREAANMEQLEGIQQRAMELAANGPVDGLFTLFQMMPNRGLGPCAKHAPLAAVLCKLTARELQVADLTRPALVRAALTMNICVARQPDAMTRQTTTRSPEQQRLIQGHLQLGAGIPHGCGVFDGNSVHWQGVLTRQACRPAHPPCNATMVTQPAETSLRIGSATIMAVGCYPPATCVAISNGETASAPPAVSIMNAAGLALAQYVVARDPLDKAFSILVPDGA